MRDIHRKGRGAAVPLLAAPPEKQGTMGEARICSFIQSKQFMAIPKLCLFKSAHIRNKQTLTGSVSAAVFVSRNRSGNQSDSKF
jgi:hypothetical protein